MPCACFTTRSSSTRRRRSSRHSIASSQWGVVIDVRIGKRGQIVIPVEVRRRLHLRDGDVLALTLDEDQSRLELHPVPSHRVERFRQAAAKYYAGVDVDAAINQLRDEWES